MTCCLLAVARDEDNFIDEWINYHLNLGFDHIYICDNNAVDKQLIIDNQKVTIYDVRGEDFSKNNYGKPYSIQVHIYNEHLSKIDTSYDYCAICDIDEFFDFKGLNLKEFIQKEIIDKGYTLAEIPWQIYTDNGLIHHIDKPILDLYIEECHTMPFQWCKNECSWGKSIFKLNKGIKYHIHWPNPESMPNFNSNHVTHEIAVVKHYRTKCLEDYLNHKVKNQCFASAPASQGNIIKTYFDFNEVTYDKILYILKFCKNNDYIITDIDREFILKSLDKIKPLTIVIRTHNRINELVNCVGSLYKQTYTPNILILDDNSNDETFRYVSNLKNVSYFKSNQNVGPGGIITYGKHLIQTPYYIILDDDDYYKDNNFVEAFYNIFIDNPDYDMYDSNYRLHWGSIVKTQKLLECPVLSAWAKDDWYFDWIKNNSVHCPQIINNRFYKYIYLNVEGKAHLVDETNISFVIKNFYNEEKYDEILIYIDNMYHLCNEKERKVFDEAKKYIIKNKLNTISTPQK